jgi:hypothetical protein
MRILDEQVIADIDDVKNTSEISKSLLKGLLEFYDSDREQETECNLIKSLANFFKKQLK